MLVELDCQGAWLQFHFAIVDYHIKNLHRCICLREAHDCHPCVILYQLEIQNLVLALKKLVL